MNKKFLIIIPIILFSVIIYLLFSGNRVLISETKVESGQNYVVSEWGNLGEAEQASLVCKYFDWEVCQNFRLLVFPKQCTW